MEFKIFKWLKKLLHRHNLIYTSRVLVGYGSRVTNMGGLVEVDATNKYLVEGYCVSCGYKFKGTQETLQAFDRPQPYDKERKLDDVH